MHPSHKQKGRETEMGRRRVQQRLAGIHLILSCIEEIHLNNKIQSAWQHQTGLFSEWFSHKRFIKRMSYGFSFQTHKFSNSIIPFPRSRHCARVCACVAKDYQKYSEKTTHYFKEFFPFKTTPTYSIRFKWQCFTRSAVIKTSEGKVVWNSVAAGRCVASFLHLSSDFSIQQHI